MANKRSSAPGQLPLGDLIRRAFASPAPDETADEKATRLRAATLDGALEALAIARARNDPTKILSAIAAAQKALELNGQAAPVARREAVTIQIVEADVDDDPADSPVQATDPGVQSAGAGTRH